MIFLSQKIKDHILYPTGRFTRWEAWIDLLLLVKEDQTQGSEMEFQKRWNWSRGMVRSFFSYLESNKLLQRSTTKTTTNITITGIDNYRVGQPSIQPSQPTDGCPKKRRKKPLLVNSDMTVDQKKNEFKKKMNDVINGSNQKTKDYFSANKYRQAVLFFDYWTEADSKGEMLWEKKPVFDINGRMTRWMLNNYSSSSSSNIPADQLSELKRKITQTLSQ